MSGTIHSSPFVAFDARPDGRSHAQLRATPFKRSALTRADGSVRFALGATTVLAAVHGPVAVEGSKEKTDRAIVEVSIKNRISPANALICMFIDNSTHAGRTSETFPIINGLPQYPITLPILSLPFSLPRVYIPFLPTAPQEYELSSQLREIFETVIALDQHPRTKFVVCIK